MTNARARAVFDGTKVPVSIYFCKGKLLSTEDTPRDVAFCSIRWLLLKVPNCLGHNFGERLSTVFAIRRFVYFSYNTWFSGEVKIGWPEFLRVIITCSMSSSSRGKNSLRVPS
jgi:hypothetical protein